MGRATLWAFDERDAEIINALKKRPMSLLVLSRETGLPYQTVYRRIRELEDKGIVKAAKVATVKRTVYALPSDWRERVIRIVCSEARRYIRETLEALGVGVEDELQVCEDRHEEDTPREHP